VINYCNAAGALVVGYENFSRLDAHRESVTRAVRGLLRGRVDFLAGRNYCWFSLKADGRLQPAAMDLDLYDANLVALPAERAEGISKMLAEKECA